MRLEGDPLEAARSLLGMTLVSTAGGETTAVGIDEVEAYGGRDDPASHAFRGPTARNRSMYGPPGTVYVYRSYGIHWCLNIVCGAEGDPAAVLIRGGKPVCGRKVMEWRRRRHDHLTDGPGKLCQAMGVDGSMDGSLLGAGALSLEAGPSQGGEIEATGRVGIRRGVDLPWRLVLRG